MTSIRLALAALFAPLLFACGASTPAPAPPTSSANAISVIAADRAFDELCASQGLPEAFHRIFSDQAWSFGPGQPPVHGKAALDADNASWPKDATLHWTPAHGEASADGTLGWTWGHYVMQLPGKTPETGKYVTIWRRERGQWRVIADTGVKD